MSTPAFENGWMVPDHDYQAHSGATTSHGPITVVYRKGGSEGKLVAIETLSYDGNGNVLTRSIEWADDIFM